MVCLDNKFYIFCDPSFKFFLNGIYITNKCCLNCFNKVYSFIAFCRLVYMSCHMYVISNFNDSHSVANQKRGRLGNPETLKTMSYCILSNI